MTARKTPETDNRKPVDIVAEIVAHLTRYAYFANDAQPLVLALWILHTHTFSPSFPRAPWVTPYMYVNSTGPACGKTLVMELCESLVLNPEKAGSISAAGLYRMIESYSPTILVDEVDTVFHGKSNEDLRNTLNTGYKHGGYTVRVSGGEAVKFQTFSPKMLVGIRDEMHEVPETVRTRAVPITLRPKPADAETEIYYEFQAGPIAAELVELISAWVTVNAERIIDTMPQPGDDVPLFKEKPRSFEISFPLLQIATVAGYGKQAREALALLLAPEPKRESESVKMMRQIRELFDGGDDGQRDKVFTSEICEAVGGVSGKRLSGMLKPFGITGNNTIQIGQRVAKGYWRHQFEDAFERTGV